MKFQTELSTPKGDDTDWTFLLVPIEVSSKLPRRGRTSVEGTLNGHPFKTTLEPDGQKSHWMKVDKELSNAAGVSGGEQVEVTMQALDEEPEPQLPTDLGSALEADDEARKTWEATTTLSRVDWIHWVESAKQSKTRKKRIEDACDMLSSGKKRVCCFDNSGVYSKALKAPTPA